MLENRKNTTAELEEDVKSEFKQLQASLAVNLALKEKGLLKDIGKMFDANGVSQDFLDYVLSFYQPPGMTTLASSIKRAFPLN